MDTKKFKINASEKANGEKVKITKSQPLSKAGFTVLGGITGAVLSTAANAYKQDREEENPVDDNENAQQPIANEGQAPVVEQYEPQLDDEADDIWLEEQEANIEQDEMVEDIDPDEVAAELTDDIDPDDIDEAILFTPSGYSEAYLPDGTRQFIIVGQDPDGNYYMLADIDGDGIFGDFFDTDGNLVAQQSEGLTVSDIVEMADDTGGYIAGLTEPWEDDNALDGFMANQFVNEDGIIDDPLLEEDLLAQLIDEVDLSDDSEWDRIFGGEADDTDGDDGSVEDDGVDGADDEEDSDDNDSDES